MAEQDPRFIDYLVHVAQDNKARGVIEEPRVFYDVVTLRDTDPLVTNFTNDVFRNGEPFPVRITHMIVSPVPDFGQDAFTDERLSQWIGLRLRMNDTNYMNDLLIPSPLWSNKLVAGPDYVTNGLAQWTFDRPVILSARDTLRIDFQPQAGAFAAEEGDHYVSAALTGVGLLSKQPYFFSARSLVAEGSTTKSTLAPVDFKNDGSEPIALTDVSFQSTGGLDASSSVGDIRAVKYQIQQIGNGTQRPWFIGAPGLPLCPGQALGYSSGRSIVHRFPGDGLMWSPGEGLTAQVAALNSSAVGGMDVVLAFAGYITVE